MKRNYSNFILLLLGVGLIAACSASHRQSARPYAATATPTPVEGLALYRDDAGVLCTGPDPAPAGWPYGKPVGADRAGVPPCE